MIVERKIRLYVESGVEALPREVRRQAKVGLTDEITKLVKMRADGRVPDILTVRDVLRGLGDPGDYAKRWYERTGRNGRPEQNTRSFRETFEWLVETGKRVVVRTE